VDESESDMTALGFLGQFGDAIQFIFQGETTREGTEVGGSQFLTLTIDHLELSIVAMAVACAIAIPLGLWLGHKGRWQFLAISVSNIGRAVPSLALIAFFVAYLGTGFVNVTLALVLLAIPPILTNAYVGVTQVNADTVDAARGMGMTEGEIVRRVELPLALPLIFGGIRISAVNVIATATIAPLAGINTLGDPIINSSGYGETGQLAAAMLVAALAVLAELLLGAAQRAVTPEGIKLEATASRRKRIPTTIRRQAQT